MLRALGVLLLGLMLLAGGTAPSVAATVKLTVNDTPITDYAISQRLKLFKLEGRSGTKAATDELIDEALMLQEAKRLGITVSDAQVAQGLLNLSRNIKVSPEKLKQILSANGVSLSTLQDRLRAAIAWGQVTQTAISPRIQISELSLEQKAAEQNKANGFDYILKEIIFVSAGGGGAGGRTAQANQYRKGFKGCDSAVERSLSFTDAAVLDIGRRHSTQLPEPVAAELAKLKVGGITKPRVMDLGVSMLAICSKEEARDLTFIQGQLRQEAGNEALKAEVDTYLKELRGKARIVYR